MKKAPSSSVYRKRRIFLDTNVILDYLLEREPFYYDALKLWAACEEGIVEGYVSALTVNNVHYIAHRLKSETTAMIAVRGILSIFNVVPLDKDIMNEDYARTDWSQGPYTLDDILKVISVVKNCCGFDICGEKKRRSYG